MSFIPDDYEEPASCGVVLRDNSEAENLKSPKFKGYVYFSRTSLERVLASLEESGGRVAYFDLAVWPSRDQSKSAYDGSAKYRPQRKLTVEGQQLQLDLFSPTATDKTPTEAWRV